MECGLVLEPELQRLIHENQKDYDAIVQETIMESSAEIELKEQELALLRKSINECRVKREAQVHRIHLLERLIEDRSKSLDSKEKQVSSIKRQLSSYCRDIDAKEREYRTLQRSVEERSLELEVMGEALKSVKKQICEGERNLRLKEDECNWQLEMMHQLISERDEVHKKMQRTIEGCGADLSAKESRLSLVEGLILEREKELRGKDVELHNIQWKGEQLRELSVRIADCNTELRVKEEELNSMQRLIDGEGKELEFKRRNLLNSMQVKINQLVKELESNKKEFDSFQRSMREKSAELEKRERKLGEGVKDLESMKKQFEGRLKEFESKERQYGGHGKELKAKERKYEERVKEFESKEKQFEGRVEEFKSKEKQFGGRVKEIELREKQCEGQAKDLSSKEKELEGQAMELESQEKQLIGRVMELASKEKQFEGRVKEIELKEKQFEGQVKQLKSKEKHLEGQLQELESKRKQFEEQLKEFDSKQKHFEGQMKQFETEQKQFRGQVKAHSSKEKKLESKEKQYDGQVQELKAKEKQFEVRAKELESKEKEFEGQVKDLESQKNQFVAQMKEIESREAMLNGQLEGHKSKENQLEAQMKDLESEWNLYEEKLKELELKEAHFNVQLKDLKSKEDQIEDLESKRNQYEEQVKELELKEAQFRLALKNLESEEKKFEGRVKHLNSKECQLGRQQEELELKEKQYKSLRKSFEEGQLLNEKSNILHQVKAEPQDFTDAYSANNCKNLQLFLNHLKNYELVCSQVSDALQKSSDPGIVVLDTIKGFCPPQLRQELAEWDANISRRIRNLLLDELKKSSPVISSHVKQEAMKFASDWKAGITVADTDFLEVLDFLKFVATYEIGSSFIEHERKRLLDIISQHCQAPQVLGNIEKLPDNQICPMTADGRSLQLLSNDPELIGNDIFACLQASTDPATLALDIIQNPIVPRDSKGKEGVVIDGSHIILLGQLMRISPSPRIKPHIRSSAKRLAIALKANMNPSYENSSVVLGFLLLLSIYGLVSFFNEDEVFKLFEFVAQHKQAVELFRNLGFADKISDFVQNLIEKQQYIEAVRFICAYKLADKIDPVGLLRLEIASANQIRGKIGGKKPIEIKVRRKDTSIRILRNVLQCISDNNLESQDLVDKVRNHIIGLEWKKENLIVRAKQKEELGHLVSKLSSALEVHQTEEKKCANNEFSENQVQQPEETISADIAVTEDQVKVQQPEETISADITDTEDQVKVQQPKEKEIEKGAVTKNQVNVQQAEAKKPINGVLQAQQPAIALYTKQAKKLKKQAKKLKTMQSANGAVTVNQVKVQQPEAKKPGNGAVSMNQVKMQQPESQKPADRELTMNQVQGQQPEENISTNETVTTNQVQVQQPQEKKRPIEAVPTDHQLHQLAHNNKRPRTGAPHALPPHVFTPHYQHIFRPSVMPASFGLPPNDYAVTGGPNYFCHPRPYPPPF